MPKKPKEVEVKERRRRQGEWFKWRWEFLRRNDEYRQIYCEAIEKRKLTSSFPSEWEKTQVNKFGLFGDCLVNPDKTIDVINKTINKIYKGLSPKTNNIEEVILKFPKCEELRFYPKFFYSHYAEVDYRPYGYLKIEVDLSKINFIGSLKKELHALIDMISDDLSKMPEEVKKYCPGLQGHRLLGNKHFARILKHGDMIISEKNNGEQNPVMAAFRKLYSKILSTETDSSQCNICIKNTDDNYDACNSCTYFTNSVTKETSLYGQMHQDYKLYKELIDEGYRGITYP